MVYILRRPNGGCIASRTDNSRRVDAPAVDSSRRRRHIGSPRWPAVLVIGYGAAYTCLRGPRRMATAALLDGFSARVCPSVGR